MANDTLIARIRALNLGNDPDVQSALRRLQPEVQDDTIFDFARQPSVRTEEGFGFGDLISPRGASTVAQNLPFSLAERGREFEQVIRSPLESLSALFDVGMGTLDVGAEAFGAQPTERGRQARQVGRTLVSEVTDPRKIAEDPLAALSNVASVAFPALRAGKLPRAARAAQVASDIPSAVAGPLAGLGLKAAERVAAPVVKAGRAAQEFSSEALADLLGVTTGAGGEKIRQAVIAGFEGNADAFRKAVDDRVIDADIAGQVEQQVRQIKDDLGRAKGEFVELHARELLDTGDLREAIFGADGTLDRLGVDVSFSPSRGLEIGTPEQARFKPIQDAIQLIDEIAPHGERNPFAEFRKIDEVKQALDNLFKKGEVSGAITQDMRRAVNETLNQVEGFERVNAPLSKLNNFTEAVEQSFGFDFSRPRARELSPELSREVDEILGAELRPEEFTGTRPGRRLLSGLGENREAELRAITQLENLVGEPLRAQLSGAGLSQLPPKGLVGRGAASEILRGGIAAAGGAGTFAAGQVSPILGVGVGLGSLALFSPRIVGKLATQVGLKANQIDQLRASIGSLREGAKLRGLSQTITLGEMLERVQRDQQREEEPLDAIGSLGAIGRFAR